jgi:exonuclease SbcC
LADWRYLERACGRDGIQALELDAMGPSIAETANGLLDAAYGSRFRVEIRTTRIAGRGSKTKQVEDFELIVHDTERGTEQPLDTLSGGETVWIRKALYDAFGIIRARTTGTKFLTVCLDEADGALDPEARRRYVAMLRAAHEAAGRRHTICITHSEDAQQAIGQRIDMREFAGSAVTA